MGRRTRTDWPAPALPTWQVYDGQVAVDTGEETMTLSMRDGHPLALAVREGFWADDCAVWANLTSLWVGGIAFRIQDKNNYFLLLPLMDSVFLCWVRDGNWTVVDVGYVADEMDWSVRTRVWAAR